MVVLFMISIDEAKLTRAMEVAIKNEDYVKICFKEGLVVTSAGEYLGEYDL